MQVQKTLSGMAQPMGDLQLVNLQEGRKMENQLTGWNELHDPCQF